MTLDNRNDFGREENVCASVKLKVLPNLVAHLKSFCPKALSANDELLKIFTVFKQVIEFLLAWQSLLDLTQESNVETL